jgi:hypothetical protein
MNADPETSSSTVPAPPHDHLLRELAAKRRQRLIEYALLIALQFVLTSLLGSQTQPVFAIALSASTAGLAWSMAALREQRRTRSEHDSGRILGDTLESFGLMLFIFSSGMAAQVLGVPRVSFMAHLAVVVLAYFCGSLIGEQFWFRRTFARLPSEAQQHYVSNLNRSVIFPYNIPFLRSVFGGQTPRKPDSHKRSGNNKTE